MPSTFFISAQTITSPFIHTCTLFDLCPVFYTTHTLLPLAASKLKCAEAGSPMQDDSQLPDVWFLHVH